MNKTSIFLSLFFSFLLPLCGLAQAWTGATDNDWSKGSNWDGGAVPTATGTVNIPNVANDPLIVLGTAAVAKSVTVHNGALLTINGGGSLSIGGGTANGLNNSGTVNNHGTISVNQASGSSSEGVANFATLTNYGTIQVNQVNGDGIFNTGTFTNKATIHIGATTQASGNGIYNNGSFIHESGNIRIDRTGSNGIHNFGGTFTNKAAIAIGGADGGVITGNGISNEAAFTNESGSIAIDRTTGESILNVNGTFTNKAAIIIGGNAAVDNQGIDNAATFINESGSIAIDRTAYQGIYTEGTFTNKAMISIGANEAIGNNGIQNRGIFVNESGSISIDRTVFEAIQNTGGTFTNKASISIGGYAEVNDNGIQNWATFLNESGSISIDRTEHEGIYNVSGTFTNKAGITIGAYAPIDDDGIENNATFLNESGSISIDRTLYQGIVNTEGTFTNKATLTIGANAMIGEAGIHNNDNATFVNESGSITIDRTGNEGIYHVSGTFTNKAGITIGAYAPIDDDGIENEGTFINESGSISIDRTEYNGIFNYTGTFTNKAAIIIGANQATGDHGIQNNTTFVNEAGSIVIDRADSDGIFNFGTFTNKSILTVGANGPIGVDALANDGTFVNDNCARTSLYNNLSNFENLSNKGLLSINTDQAHFNSGTFTNDGIIEYPQGNPVPNVTNNDLIVGPLFSECSSTFSPVLQIGGANSFAVSTNWYEDLGLTVPGGTYNPATMTFTATNLAEGNSDVRYFSVTDLINICSRTVSILLTRDDMTIPVIECPGNVTVASNIFNPCSAVVNGIDADFSDNCSGPALAYSLSGATTGGGGGQASGLTFLSGVTNVSYTVTDGSQLSASCVFTVTVSDCSTEISGTLIWEHDDASGVGNATVALTGDQSGSTTTPADGTYSFTVTSGSNFTVTPSKTINKLNGVTTADATRIQQHVANSNPITDLYKIVAADVNKSNSVTTQDASIINQALLGNPAALAQFKTSWRFVPTSHTMNTPPWGFPEKITLEDVQGNVPEQNFFGIKTGDVITPYTDPANFNGSATPEFVLNIADQSLQFGEQVSIIFSANQFSDLAALQFALQFDVEKLAFVGIEPLAGLPFTTENFGTYQVSEGSVNVVWSQAEGVFIEEAAPIFQLTFNVLETGGMLSEALQLAEEVLEGHAYTSALADNKVSLYFFGTTSAEYPVAQDQIELLQNRPNPFNSRTTIGFVLPESCEAQLRVFDASGRVLFLQKKNYAAGRSEETLELEGANGVLWYELATPFGSMTKKMIAGF